MQPLLEKQKTPGGNMHGGVGNIHWFLVCIGGIESCWVRVNPEKSKSKISRKNEIRRQEQGVNPMYGFMLLKTKENPIKIIRHNCNYVEITTTD